MRLLCTVLGVLVAFHAAQGQDPLVLELEGVTDRRIPIAIPPAAAGPGSTDLAELVAEVLSYDLDFSGHFTVLSSQDYPANFGGFTGDATQISFEGWRRTPAEFLIYTYVTERDGALVAECRLFDVYDGVQVVGKRLSTSGRRWARQLAHQFADEVVLFLTGRLGIATSQIVFSAGPSGEKEIFIADYDGADARQLTHHGSISITPEFSPDGTRLAYVSYKDRQQHLYVLTLATGESVPLSQAQGMNAAPSWSPDGSEVAVVRSTDGRPNIYLMSVDGSNVRQLTSERTVDSSPTFSPDGQRIAFVSERVGAPQIYVMNRNGEDVRRLSFQGGSNYDPEWSPCGDYITYVVNRRGEGFQIYVMNADGQNPRRLTNSGGRNESPSWSADSRHILFSSSRRGPQELWTVTLETGQERLVPNLAGRGGQGPSWGPRRHPD